MASHFRKFFALNALLLASTAAWASRGDIDPRYGDGGRLDTGTEVLLQLPDDRLVGGIGTDGGYLLRRFDAAGHPDPTFGDDGEVVVPLPAGQPNFQAAFIAAAPDGALLLGGTLADTEATRIFEAVLRVDAAGRLDEAFGGQGDGFLRLTDAPLPTLDAGVVPTTLMAIAVDGAGRVLLAERSWSPDGRCNGPTRIVRLMPAGAADTSFGTNGRSDALGVDLCGGAALFGVRNDGSVVVGARGAIAGLDAAGGFDASFGIDGRVTDGLPGDWTVGRLLPDGSLLIAARGGTTESANTHLLKFDRSGQPDAGYGGGTGTVSIDLGTAFYGTAGTRQSVGGLALTADAAGLYLQLKILRADGSAACAGGIARLTLDGVPDVSFGRDGLTCLNFESILYAVQSDGAPLFGTFTGVHHVLRLLTDATPSPGLLTMLGSGTPYRRLYAGAAVTVGEADGRVNVAVTRVAGRDGAISVEYRTGPRPLGHVDDPAILDATPGSDFEAVTGRLDWADGDDAPRNIAVPILDDNLDETVEIFSVGISAADGGAQIAGSNVSIAIEDNDELNAPPEQTPTAEPTPASSSGGGGSTSWPVLLGLLALCVLRRRRPAANTTAALILNGTAALMNLDVAQAARGDIDADYGDGGYLDAGAHVLLQLPDDRVVSGTSTPGGLVVRRYDAAGHLDPTFGTAGEVVLPLPSATPSFEVSHAVGAPDGGLLFGGFFKVAVAGAGDEISEALLRIDANGQLDTTFGGQGDGVFRLTDAPVPPPANGVLATVLMDVAVDAAGRILLAERDWSADGQCVPTTSVLRLTPDGTPDPAFGTDGHVDALNVDLCGGVALFGVRADGSSVVGARGAIAGLDANGAPDAAFGVNGNLSDGLPDDWPRGRLLADGRLLLVAPGTADPVLWIFDRSGHPDAVYGGGTGSVTTALGTVCDAAAGAAPTADDFLLSTDGAHVYLRLSIRRADGFLLNQGIARLGLDGTPDTGFGRQGLTCLSYGAWSFGLLAVQDDGAPLLSLDGGLLRLLSGDTPSPGLLTLVSSRDAGIGYVASYGNESDGSATVTVMRTAGRDGAVSADYAAVPRQVRFVCSSASGGCVSTGATPDSDFSLAAGRLDWVDGEDGPKSIAVSIVNDDLEEGVESFGIDFSGVTGGVVPIAANAAVVIPPNDEPATPEPTPPPVTTPQGGGGSTSWPALLGLLALYVLRQRRPVAKIGAAIALVGSAMLMHTEAAYAARGGIDPDYGVATNGFSLNLPDDRLLVADGLSLSRFTADGGIDTTFGDQGSIVVPLPDATPSFWVRFGAVAPDGGLVLAGIVSDSNGTTNFEAVQRLDADGHRVASFGGQGEGLRRLTEEPLQQLPGNIAAVVSAMIVDASGRVLLAEHSWGNAGCSTPTVIERLTADGAPDVSFGTNGRVEIAELDLCGGAALFGVRGDGGIVIGARGIVVAFDANGVLDASFGTNGRIASGLPADWARGRLLPDGGFLVIGRSGPSASADTLIAKFDRFGQPDATFGGGTGAVHVDLGTDLLGLAASRQSVQEFLFAPDGANLVLQLSLLRSDGTAACATGIARVSTAGIADAGFGLRGLTCLDYDHTAGPFVQSSFQLFAAQASGAPLFTWTHNYNERVYRLLVDDTASPGILVYSVAGRSPDDAVTEAGGAATFTATRVGGHDGALSLSYATVPRTVRLPCDDSHDCSKRTAGATAGSDYTDASGHFDWSDGEEGPRSVTITIIDDNKSEPYETFGLDVAETTGDAVVFNGDNTTVGIQANEGAPTPTPQPSSSDGGGGSVSWLVLLALAAIVLLCERRCAIRVAVSVVATAILSRKMADTAHAMAIPRHGVKYFRSRSAATTPP